MQTNPFSRGVGACRGADRVVVIRRSELFRGSAILTEGASQTTTLIRGPRDLRLTLGDLKSAGEMAGLSSVVLRIVFEPELMKSISSLSPRFSFTRPIPNEACSIQS
jgi:hypothetical protein